MMQPNETTNALQFTLRLTEITRWGIMATSRQQSVAEHSYRVMMIAMSLYDYAQGGVNHNSFERNDVLKLALVHDMFEILSGDLNSIFKHTLEFLHPGVYEQTVENMAAGRRDTSALYQQVMKVERAAKGTPVEAYVKIADFLEAITYIETYGAYHKHRAHVVDDLKGRLWIKIADFHKAGTLRPEQATLAITFARDLLDDPGLAGSPVPVAPKLMPPRCPAESLKPQGGMCMLPTGHTGDHLFP